MFSLNLSFKNQEKAAGMRRSCQVSKLLLSVQSCAYGSEDGELTADIVKKVVSQKTREHTAKLDMRR